MSIGVCAIFTTSTDTEDEGRKFSQDVRGMEVMRLLGDKVNPHNRLK